MAASICCLGRAASRTLLRKTEATLAPAIVCLKSRASSSYQYDHCYIDFSKLKVQSPQYDESKLTDFEVSKDPKEWQFVERLMPLIIVPTPKKFDGPAASGWTSPKEEAIKLPYFIPRNKNHMQQVYLHLSYRNERKITVVRKIQGDIWKLEQDLRAHIESKYSYRYRHLGSRVNEMAGTIKFRGDHVAYVKQWMDMKGF